MTAGSFGFHRSDSIYAETYAVSVESAVSASDALQVAYERDRGSHSISARLTRDGGHLSFVAAHPQLGAHL
jgi:hypothetical protein